MKQLFFVFISVFILQNTWAQLGSIEVMGGNRYFQYQHSLSQYMKAESRFGWQHIATLVKRYNANTETVKMPDELMNQAYLTFRLHPYLLLKGGLFYTNAGGYQPALGMQFTIRKKDWAVVMAPRIDINKNGSYELFTLVEFSPSITSKTKLYTRLQAMSNFSSANHNRSYQQARIGVETRSFQLGGGITFDQYGTTGKQHCNSGIFIRRLL